MEIAQLRVAKGHGTGNDFVLFVDADGSIMAHIDDPQELAAALCDRRFGLGGDGLLRAVRVDSNDAAVNDVLNEVDSDADAEWFMDYRNHDGSIAEMCGNGMRVFVRYLIERELLTPGEHKILTRGGAMTVTAPASPDDPISVDLGSPRFHCEPVQVWANGGGPWVGFGLHLPNPHVVVVIDPTAFDNLGPLATAPSVVPDANFPDGVNVEFVSIRGDHHVAMRVHERGSGETLSCGTGAAAVGSVIAREEAAPVSVRVDVPGGSLVVTRDEAGHVHLAGPAVIVAHGTVDLGALRRG